MDRKVSHFQKPEPFAENILREVRFITANGYISNNSIVADLGCGFYGSFLLRIANKIKRGIGFDINVSKKIKSKNIKLMKSDINRRIQNRNTLFDFVTALAVLEHVENPDLFIKKINKILKKGGRLIITTPHIRSKKILEFLAFKLKLISGDEIRDHKNYFDKSKITKLLIRNKFKIITLKTFEFGLNIVCVAQK